MCVVIVNGAHFYLQKAKRDFKALRNYQAIRDAWRGPWRGHIRAAQLEELREASRNLFNLYARVKGNLQLIEVTLCHFWISQPSF